MSDAVFPPKRILPCNFNHYFVQAFNAKNKTIFLHVTFLFIACNLAKKCYFLECTPRIVQGNVQGVY